MAVKTEIFTAKSVNKKCAGVLDLFGGSLSCSEDDYYTVHA